MPTFEVNDETWASKEVSLDRTKVQSVTFNEAAQTTEIEIKDGKTYIANMGFHVEVSDPAIIPVKGTVKEVKSKLGM